MRRTDVVVLAIVACAVAVGVLLVWAYRAGVQGGQAPGGTVYCRDYGPAATGLSPGNPVYGDTALYGPGTGYGTPAGACTSLDVFSGEDFRPGQAP